MNTKNEKTNSHPEFSSGSKDYGFRNKFGMTKSGEHGRSIVEMLGVVAIVGILSIGAVSGYTTAMKKYKANELLNEASKRAAVIAMQIASEQTLSITEFGNNEVAGATFSAPVAGNSTFKMTLSGVDEGVCEQIKNMLGNDAPMAIKESCGASDLTLIFNKDLKRGNISLNDEYSSSSTGGQGDSNEDTCDPVCQAGQTCVSGHCVEIAEAAEGGCTKNSECNTWCSEHNAEKCYCKIVSTWNGSGEDFSGNCAEATTGNVPSGFTGVPPDGNDKVTWYAAYNFCKAWNLPMASKQTACNNEPSQCPGNGEVYYWLADYVGVYEYYSDEKFNVTSYKNQHPEMFDSFPAGDPAVFPGILCVGEK